MLLWLLLLLSLLLFIIKFYKWCYHHLYQPYLDCQIHLQHVKSVTSIPNNPNALLDTVVIAGGSFAGLSTAIVLSPYFKQVIIVDRGHMIENESITDSRQGQQAHVIAYRSLLIWDRLFPGFLKELEELVKTNKLCQFVAPNKELKYDYKGMNISDTSAMRKNPMVVATRGQVETVLRNRVRSELGNVKIYEGYSIASQGVHYEKKGNVLKITSITATKIGANNEDEQSNSVTFPCDLFVNCAGAGSHHLLKHIEKDLLSQQQNQHSTSSQTSLLTHSRIDCKIRYQTILFEPKEGILDQDGKIALNTVEKVVNQNRKLGDIFTIVYHMLSYPRRRGFLAMPYSNHQYLILIATYNQKMDPIDEENAKERVIEFAQQASSENPLLEKDVRQVMSKFKDRAVRVIPLYEKSGSEFVHYEHLKNNLEGFLAIGDSVASLNPIYGQGVTMAAESALLVQDMIQKELQKKTNENETSLFQASFCSRVQDALSKSYFIPWLLCSTTDLSYDFANFTPDLKFQHWISPIMCWLLDRLFQSASQYSWATEYLLRVILMEQGFRKELMNPVWMFGYLFWKETLAIVCGVVATMYWMYSYSLF
ncbi:hypothetical protein C9374_011038 [Naegleria lovaniensis]|uniref:FAD/NAD(P)-binding domain-containing protein n=1 Tax=Naegleria lovaniensis TaxID=51637 RepID=A0AA88GCX0_NAELO|nr:uncharacterized protein C9374_011038 [Naegleria lovaniensis]KAG2374201.1 hypothetical protein C9374_011038 [Naegleria lovaniensis]